jgi:hypothetical protein
MDITLLNKKLRELISIDDKKLFRTKCYRIYGSDSHKYKINAKLSDSRIIDFEKLHKISLPQDYKDFLTKIGNGGVGPYYGLFKLEQWNFDDYGNINQDLSQPFPYSENWNDLIEFEENEDYTETEEFKKWEEHYFNDSHTNGAIRICHYGCAVHFFLIVNGKEFGNVWIDDRTSDKGLFPVLSKATGQRMSFSDWYYEWIESSLNELEIKTHRCLLNLIIFLCIILKDSKLNYKRYVHDLNLNFVFVSFL